MNVLVICLLLAGLTVAFCHNGTTVAGNNSTVTTVKLHHVNNTDLSGAPPSHSTSEQPVATPGSAHVNVHTTAPPLTPAPHKAITPVAGHDTVAIVTNETVTTIDGNASSLALPVGHAPELIYPASPGNASAHVKTDNDTVSVHHSHAVAANHSLIVSLTNASAVTTHVATTTTPAHHPTTKAVVVTTAAPPPPATTPAAPPATTPAPPPATTHAVAATTKPAAGHNAANYIGNNVHCYIACLLLAFLFKWQ